MEKYEFSIIYQNKCIFPNASSSAVIQFLNYIRHKQVTKFPDEFPKQMLKTAYQSSVLEKFPRSNTLFTSSVYLMIDDKTLESRWKLI